MKTQIIHLATTVPCYSTWHVVGMVPELQRISVEDLKFLSQDTRAVKIKMGTYILSGGPLIYREDL